MPNLRIDNILPSGVAHTIDTDGDLRLQHGGLVTRFLFDKVEMCDLETFKTQIAPNIRKDDGNLYVVRNSVEGAASFILGDRCFTYHLTNMEEVRLDALLEKIKPEESQELFVVTPNMTYPLVRYIRRPHSLTVIAKIPTSQRIYRQALDSEGDRVEAFSYYPPPCWMRFDMTLSGALNSANIAVVTEPAMEAKDTVLRAWPLANADSYTGCICFGDSYALGEPVKDINLGYTVSQLVEKFFNSNHNYDLIPNALPTAMADSRIEIMLPVSAEASQRHKNVLKALSTMQTPEGWRNFNWNVMPRINTQTFIHA